MYRTGESTFVSIRDALIKYTQREATITSHVNRKFQCLKLILCIVNGKIQRKDCIRSDIGIQHSKKFGGEENVRL